MDRMLTSNVFKAVLLSFMLLPFHGESQTLSGSKKMDYLITKMIDDLNMTESVQTNFIAVYKIYGGIMKKAQDSDISRWQLYLTYLRASRERDRQMGEFLSKNQYALYEKRQKHIDDIASKM